MKYYRIAWPEEVHLRRRAHGRCGSRHTSTRPGDFRRARKPGGCGALPGWPGFLFQHRGSINLKAAVERSRQHSNARFQRARRAKEGSPRREPWDCRNIQWSPGTGRKTRAAPFFRPVPGLCFIRSQPSACALGYILTLLRSYVGFRPIRNLNCRAVHLSGESLFPSEGLQTRELD